MLGILLSAGHSRRFGTQDKLLQPLPDGTGLAAKALANLLAATPEVVAVTRPGSQVLQQQLAAAGARVLICEEHEQEMADSLAAAIRFARSLDATKDGFLIALADMPYIKTATMQAVQAALTQGAAIVVPSYQGKRGHPVAFAARYADELQALQGDHGARALLQRHAAQVLVLEVNDAGILQDIDTPADLAAR